MDYQEYEISGEGGRTIAVATFGDPGGTTVVFHHGSPGSSNQARYFEGFAESDGLYVVGFSRPGYGTSSRQAGRSVASVVADVDAVLDALGATTTCQWGGRAVARIRWPARRSGRHAAERRGPWRVSCPWTSTLTGRRAWAPRTSRSLPWR